MKRFTCLCALLLSVLTVAPVNASSFAELHGVATYVSTLYGSGGYINRIEITVDTHDGMSWLLVCRRSNYNLGQCSTITQGDSLIGFGQHSSYTTVEATEIHDKGPIVLPATGRGPVLLPATPADEE